MADQPASSLAGAGRAARLARMLASPVGVLVIVPLLVIAAGVVVLLLGRRATSDASDSMARRQLTAQANDVEHDVAFALDQADPLLASLDGLADPALPIEDVAVKLHDLVVGRPGIANVSISFPSGVLRGTFVDDKSGDVRVQESIVGARGTARTNYIIVHGRASAASVATTDYDPRTRQHYELATRDGKRVWLPPRTFFTSHRTGLTIAEPRFGPEVGTDEAGGRPPRSSVGDRALRAVTTVDFDVTALSSFIVRAPVDGARTIVFAGDGTILASSGIAVPDAAMRENRLLRHADFADPAIEALFAEFRPNARFAFVELHSSAGDFLASVAPIGGQHARVDAPLDWYLATLVPEQILFGPTHRLERQTLIASGGALAIAMGVALMFAWNLVRMRRAVTTARERARSAEARAKELGSYRLLGRLGAGGMGEVWRAEHRLLARQAAIKLVRPDALRDPRVAPKVRERFRREAQTLASMRSPHTISLHDYGVTDDGTFYYVMELVDGVDLDKLVRQHGPLPAARAIHVLVQACGSLAEAHDAGLLHRDIKPANLMTCRAADEVDVVKVLDFGIVRTSDPADPVQVVSLPPIEGGELEPAHSGRLTQIGAVVGTPGFISPEQLVQQETDARGDLYALGCVAWWLLVGDEVFPRATEDEVLKAHLKEEPPRLRDRAKGWIPDELARIVASLLAKRPADRPTDARSLARALRAIAIPHEHEWTTDRAQAWWFAHRPPSAAPIVAAPGAETSVERLVVPRYSENTDAGAPTIVPAASADAPTLAERSR